MTDEPARPRAAPARRTSPARIVVSTLADLAPARELETLRALYALADRVAAAGSHVEIHEAALDALMEAVAPDRSSVLAFDASGLMRFQAWRRLSDGYRRAVDGHSPWARDAEDPEPIVVPDVAKDAALETLRDTIVGEGIRACAFIPLVHQRRLMGKFMLYHDAPHAYTPDELRAARAIAAHVAAALARWEAQGELERARSQAHRLEKMSALGSLVAGVAHEIRTPLTSLVNALHLIESRAKRVGDPTLSEMSGNLVEDALRINRLVEDLRRFTRLDTPGKAVAPLYPTVAEAVTLFDAAHRGACAVSTDLRETPDVAHDRVQIQQVVLNLLDNALAATREAGGAIRVETRTEAGDAVLVVSDDGPGMPPEVASRMWEEFYTTKPDGTGLGLSIVKRIVTAHGGTVACATSPGMGTTFRIRLPSS